MGFMGRIPKNATFHLTNEGRERLINYMSTPQDRVLAALETNSSLTPDEIKRFTGLSGGAVEKYLTALSQKGYVQRVGQGSPYTPTMEDDL